MPRPPTPEEFYAQKLAEQRQKEAQQAQQDALDMQDRQAWNQFKYAGLGAFGGAAINKGVDMAFSAFDTPSQLDKARDLASALQAYEKFKDVPGVDATALASELKLDSVLNSAPAPSTSVTMAQGSQPISSGAVTSIPSPSGSAPMSSAPTSMSTPFSVSDGGVISLPGAQSFAQAVGPSPTYFGQIANKLNPLAQSTPLGAVGSVLGAAGIAKGLYDIGTKTYDAFTGDHSKSDMDWSFKGIMDALPIIGDGRGPVFWAQAFGSGRDNASRLRDSVRDWLQESHGGMFANDEILGEEAEYKLADGSTWKPASVDAAYNFDMKKLKKDPRYAEGVTLANAMAWTMLPKDVDDMGGRNHRFDQAAEFMNAASSKGDPLENLKAMGANAGYGRDDFYQGTLQAYQEGRIGEDERDAALAQIDKAYGVS